MKVIAFNGSPRKTWNTATLLIKALEGAASQGAETELIHLYDLNYKGCISCFACKNKSNKSYGKCAINDELTPILAKVEDADAIILGSPNYMGSPTCMMKAFLERLIYPYVVYTLNISSLFKKKIPAGFIYTMSSNEAWMKEMRYDIASQFIEGLMKMIFGSAESLVVNNTYQFEDYSKIAGTRFDPVEKARIREEQFPKDCEKAFEMGVRFSQQVIEDNR
ncbi:MAG TPA: flavodoxin family protein [Methanosarcina sp.]|nr:flavodoxin family protein [Methanosarcina sp.]